MALTALADPVTGLADLRAASLTGKRGAPTVRDIELAFGAADPMPGESVPTEDGVLQGVAASLAEAPRARPAQMQGGYDAAQASSRRSSGTSRRARPRLRAAQEGPAARRRRRPQGASGDASAGEAADGRFGARRHGRAGTIGSREDANRALERVCEWIERNEPSNPAPLLIRRAQRLMSKSFIDIIRDLAPDGLRQVEKLAGTENT